MGGTVAAGGGIIRSAVGACRAAGHAGGRLLHFWTFRVYLLEVLGKSALKMFPKHLLEMVFLGCRFRPAARYNEVLSQEGTRT